MEGPSKLSCHGQLAVQRAVLERSQQLVSSAYLEVDLGQQVRARGQRLTDFDKGGAKLAQQVPQLQRSYRRIAFQILSSIVL